MVSKKVITQNYIIRMSLVGAVVAIVAYILQLSFYSWIWVAITVYMVMDIRYGMTLRAGINRILGAIAGTILGYFCVSIFNANNLIAITLGLFVIGLVGGYITFKNKSIQLMCMNAAVVLAMSKLASIGLPAWKIALERAIDTILGVLIVFVISALFFVGYSFNQLKQKVIVVHQLIATWLQAISAHLTDSKQTEPLSVGYFLNYQQHLKEIELLSAETSYEASEINDEESDYIQQNLSIQSRIIAQLYIFTESLNTQNSNNELFKLFERDIYALLINLKTVFDNLSHSMKSLEYLLSESKNLLDKLKVHIEQVRANRVFSTHSTDEIFKLYNIYTLLATLIDECQKFPQSNSVKTQPNNNNHHY